MGVMRIRLQVDRLVLKGFGTSEGAAVVRGLRGELGAQFARPGMAAALRAHDATSRIDAGAVRVRASVNSDSVGARIARAIGQRFSA
jgi:hypothetical protein